MRRKKATMFDIPAFFKSDDIINNDMQIIASRFILDNPLSDEKKRELLKKYNNISFGTASYRYAPEIVHTTIIIKY